jgi:hypothetical protein
MASPLEARVEAAHAALVSEAAGSEQLVTDARLAALSAFSACLVRPSPLSPRLRGAASVQLPPLERGAAHLTRTWRGRASPPHNGAFPATAPTAPT